MSSVTFKNVHKSYDNKKLIINDVSLDIKDKEFIVLVGASGCGKSTALRMIAGLEDITSGEILIDDKVVNNVHPKDRDIAFVFQSYALYPHMSVYDNIAFGLKMRKVDKQTIDKKVKEAAEILNLTQFLDRKPKQLSGGQRQRVALGRAIVRNPKVFLMDEPLSNLDAKLRVQMRTEISKLHHKLQTTFIYVTHDQVEAMTMGTRIVVMKDGIIQQVDSPQNIYNYPANLFVAGFIGSPQMNFLEGRIEKDGNEVIAIFGDNKIVLPKEKAETLVKEGYIGKTVTLGIRPEHLSDDAELIAENPNSIVKGNVEVIELMGAESYIYTRCGKDPLNVRVEGTTNLKIGEVAKLHLRAEKLHVFDKETEIRVV